jgi:hypothetical protein
MKRGRTLRELFAFPGFTPERKLMGKMGDPQARIVTLRRREKKDRFAQDVRHCTAVTMTRPLAKCVTWTLWDGGFICG